MKEFKVFYVYEVTDYQPGYGRRALVSCGATTLAEAIGGSIKDYLYYRAVGYKNLEITYEEFCVSCKGVGDVSARVGGRSTLRGRRKPCPACKGEPKRGTIGPVTVPDGDPGIIVGNNFGAGPYGNLEKL